MNPFGCNPPITINTRGIPFVASNEVTVSTTDITISFGFRRLSGIGLMVLDITEAIPTGTTATLPVNIALNGSTVPLTTFGGAAVTAGDLVGTGRILVIYDKMKNTIQVFSGIV